MKGVPSSISLVITDGTQQDYVHALYRPGSMLHLGALVRDGYGNPTAGTPSTPCTPHYVLEDFKGPDGLDRASLAGNVVTFLRPGPFTIKVECLENNRISSRGQEQIYNFETSTGRFARTTKQQAPAEAPKAQGTMGTGTRVVLAIVAVGLLGVAVYYLHNAYVLATADPGGGGCPAPSSCLHGDVLCRSDSCGCPSAYHATGHNTTYCTTQEPLVCSCNAVAVAGVGPIRDVPDLVARGLALERRPVQRSRASGSRLTVSSPAIAAATRNLARARAVAALAVDVPARDTARIITPPATATPDVIVMIPESARLGARRPDPRATARPATPSTLDVRDVALKAAFTVYAMFRQAAGPQHGAVEVAPWAEAQAAGLSLSGRF